MRPTSDAALFLDAARPRWSEVLRAVREARGVTQDGWAARMGVTRRTVQRWEAGERVPDPGAEAAMVTYCRETGLFRSYDRGPLAGLALTAEVLQHLLAEARWRVSTAPNDATALMDEPVAWPPGGTVQDRPSGVPSNLPAPLTSFVGREAEIAAVRRVMAGTRLLTLTGAGGCGKSRLSLALASELLWAYPHGVWLVELAALADERLVPPTVASALDVPVVGPRPPVEALADVLRPRSLLLVLDNCEHLLAGCAELVETLLRACPDLEVLTTSRAPLGIDGEVVWQVSPMTVPDAGFQIPAAAGAPQPGDLHTATGIPDAVRLFVERARQHRPEFRLTQQNAAAVAEVCRRLDGIPLAIELAAARVRVLTVEQIAARLGNRFHLLTGGRRTAPPRQQTLRAAMDWSYELLTEHERALLRRLSVFAGGFTLEAAEAVAGSGNRDPGPGEEGTQPATPHSSFLIPHPSVLDLLTHLVDKSLVIAEERGEVVRYRLLETVRQYAAERLDQAGEVRTTRERHAAWCIALVELDRVRTTGAEQQVWLARLDAEHDNIRAALDWCLTDGDSAAAGLRLAGGISWLWDVRGHYTEGRRWLTALLARDSPVPADVRAKALNQASLLAQQQGDYDEAGRLLEHALALRRELGDEAGIAASLNLLGTLAGRRGEYARARVLLEEGLAVARKLGSPHTVGTLLTNLGITARNQGEHERAQAHYEETLALAREQGDTRLVAIALQNLGNLHLDQYAPDQALVRYREGLSLFLHVQDRLGAARCLEGIAEIAGMGGDAERAARLCGATTALRAAIRVPLPPTRRGAFDRTTAVAREVLGDAAFAAAWAGGQALSLEAAVATALADGEAR